MNNVVELTRREVQTEFPAAWEAFKASFGTFDGDRSRYEFWLEGHDLIVAYTSTHRWDGAAGAWVRA